MCLCWDCKKKKKKCVTWGGYDQNPLGLDLVFAVTSAMKHRSPKKSCPEMSRNTRNGYKLIILIDAVASVTSKLHLIFVDGVAPVPPPCHQSWPTELPWVSPVSLTSESKNETASDLNRSTHPHTALLLLRTQICHSSTDAHMCTHHEKDHPNTQQGIFYMQFIGAAAQKLDQCNHPGWEVKHLPRPQCAAEVPLSNWPSDPKRIHPNPRQLQNYFWCQSGGTEIERGGYIF